MASEPQSSSDGDHPDLKEVDGAVDLEMEDPTGGSSGAGRLLYKLPARISGMLYPHQRQGLGWLWFLHCRVTGGIVGDDMGLGKTMQISAFLAGLFHSGLIRRVLVVVPKTPVTHWIKELTLVGLKSKISDCSGPNANVRNSELQRAVKEGGVVLTTYDIVRINYKLIRGDFYHEADDDEERNLWDYVVLDEAHQIKNPKTQRFQSICDIPCVHRIAISGTPIQNNLKVLPEKLLQSYSNLIPLYDQYVPIAILFYQCKFRERYENAINRGNEKDATNREKHIGSEVAKKLRERIKPYFLRRMKGEVSLDIGSTNGKTLGKKNELIIWLKLTDCQRQLYEAFLKSDILNTMRPPLPHITILKKICDHPLMLTKIAAEGILEGMEDMDGKLNDHDMVRLEKMALNLAGMSYDDDDDDDDDALQVGHEISCKLSFIMSLLRNLLEEGHHVLIFSQTRKMLNLVQQVISVEGYKFFRIDGTTKISERERIVKDFQEGSGTPIFLLTTKVGGLGLTLTKADRVIVVDPAWNPRMQVLLVLTQSSYSQCRQSGCRSCLSNWTDKRCDCIPLDAATVEEKIYRMQVFKWGLFRTATEQKEQTRYFNQRDIQELLSLPAQGFDISPTQKQLQKEHEQQLDMDESLRQHIEFLEQQGIAGVSHHSLLYSKTEVLPALSENDHAPDRDAHAVKPNSDVRAEDINRLTQTLANTALASVLPDRDGEEKTQGGLDDDKLTVVAAEST
ncbi:SNF2 domain-containing protein ENL1-like [Aegilops tauschii subsp. strangulata]|uniref:DNA excision repair protein ERCC-6-like protein n=1 Tax=Aegilops tauschii TaxID=37682 RepID=M8CEM4_AEGTA